MPSINPRPYQVSTPLDVAFLGLGVMGYPMAGHLAAAGHRVTVYNRTPSKAVQWAAEFPGNTALTPKEAAMKASIVFCCVGNDDDLRSVVLGPKGALAGMAKGTHFVDHTTASARVARELFQAAQEQGVGFVDAPVSGGQAGAVNGGLTIMCGGQPGDFDLIQPVAQAYAKAVTLLGGPGAGQLCKMVNQICVGGLVQALAEAIAFGQREDLDMTKVLEVIGKGAAQSWQMDNRGKTMIEGKFDFGFAVDWMRKDLSLVLEQGRANGASLPATALVDQFYAELQQAGNNRWDTSSLITRLQK